MRILAIAFVLLSATATLAHSSAMANTTAPGCGDSLTKFAVKTDRSQHPFVPPGAPARPSSIFCWTIPIS